MQKKILVWSISGFIGLLFAISLGYAAARTYLSSAYRIVAEFRGHLMAEDFSAMYRDSSDFMKLNVTEAEFVDRMRVVRNILQEYDPDLNFTRDGELENWLEKMRRDSDPDGSTDVAGHTFVILMIGNSDRKARLHVSWIRSGLKPRLFDLSLGERSLSDRVTTLAGEPFFASR